MRTERCLLATLLLLAGAAAAARAEAASVERGAAERSLEAITIEGVAKGPEVLFINAREPARVELAQGWRLVAAAGLDAPLPPPPRALRAATLDAMLIVLDSEASPHPASEE